MKTKVISVLLGLVMLLTALPALALRADAATLENRFEFDGYGSTSDSAGGEFKTNYNYAMGKNFSVKTGDRIYFGPCQPTQSYHMIAYNGSGSQMSKINAANSKVVAEFPKSGLEVLSYDVPEGVASVTPVASQLFDKCMIVTVNQEFDDNGFMDYWKSKGLDVTALLGGSSVKASEIKNLYDTGGTRSGRADAARNFVDSDSYYATNGYIPAKAGDIIYIAAAVISQGYHLSLYDENKNGTTNVTGNYMVLRENLSGGYAVYAYKIRNDSVYVRVTSSTPVHLAGIVLATVNQPFDGEVYREWCALQGKNPEPFIGMSGKTDAGKIKNLFSVSDAADGYATKDGMKNDIKDIALINCPRIEVKGGDKIYIGPYMQTAGVPALAFYDAAGDAAGELMADKLEKVTDFENGYAEYVYTVPSDACYIRINCKKDDAKYILVTKNQLFDSFTYSEWFCSITPDGENLNNPTVSTYGKYTGASGTTVNPSYSATPYISVKPGDTVYMAAAHLPQPLPAALFDSDYKGIRNIEKSFLKPVFLISDNVGMVSYTIPKGVSYLKFIFRTSVKDYVYVSKNKTITKEEYIDKMGIVIPKVDTSSKLYGKSALFAGDSITFGSRETSGFWYSWAGRLGATTGLKVVNNGVGGARVSQTGSAYHVLNELASKERDFDMIIMHGGVNDARHNIPIGNITPEGNKHFAMETFAGGLEGLFYRASVMYPKADKFYISNFHLDGHATGRARNMSAYFDMAEKICEKWGVNYINLYDNKELNDILQTRTTKYLPDTLHPDGNGYDIITKYIRSELEVFYGGNPVTGDETDTAPVETQGPDTPETTPASEPQETTAAEETASPETVPEPEQKEPDKKGGCSGSISVICTAVAIAGAALCITKKKKSN